MGPLDVIAGDDDGLAVGPQYGPGREPAQSDLGSLQIGQDPDRPIHGGGRLPYPVVSLLVLGVVTMAEVEPGHIHSSGHELTDTVGTVDRGAQRAHNLRATIHDFNPRL